MDSSNTAQIVGAFFTAVAAIAAFRTARQAKEEAEIARETFDVETQPIVMDVPRGLYSHEIDWHNADGTMTTKQVDRSEISVGASGSEPVSHVSVPIRNAGNGLARIGEASFLDSEGRSAVGWTEHPLLRPGEMTQVGLAAEASEIGGLVAASIGLEYGDFTVLVPFADARNRERGTLRLEVANGERPYVTTRQWEEAPDEDKRQPRWRWWS
jgi:hypothetical protein